jgi:hypothetical protein
VPRLLLRGAGGPHFCDSQWPSPSSGVQVVTTPP